MKTAKELIEEKIEEGMFGPQASKGNVSLHLPSTIDKELGEVYNKLVTFKLEMDAMEEVPNYLMSSYRTTLDLMNKIGKLRNVTYNFSMNFKKALRSVGVR